MDEGRDLLAVPIGDVATVRRLLVEAAKARRDICYADLLDRMGHAFSRPKMRALCKTLGAVDDAAVAKGEPELACLVVRRSDRLPGDGWWVTEAERLGYRGLWTGPEAVKFIRRRQKLAFDFWGGRRVKRRADGSARGRSGQKRSRRRSTKG